jgi:hypothetical protein
VLENEEQLFNSQAVPESLEESTEGRVIQAAFSDLFGKGKVQRLSSAGGPSFLDLSAVEQLLQKTAEEGKTGSMAARIALERFVQKFYDQLELQPSARIPNLGEDARAELVAQLMALKDTVHEKSSLRTEVEALLGYISATKKGGGENQQEREGGEITPESLARELAYDRAPRLTILYLPEPDVARQTAKRLIERLLYLRKRGGSRKRILLVLDEAQEYLTDNPRDRDGTYDSNRAVEALLRQGRKYRIHCWLATQRVAHLNVSALQQVHSYFVSTLPRFYDRMVVADSFGLPIEVMEKSSQLDTGEWIFVSFKATKQKNLIEQKGGRFEAGPYPESAGDTGPGRGIAPEAFVAGLCVGDAADLRHHSALQPRGAYWLHTNRTILYALQFPRDALLRAPGRGDRGSRRQIPLQLEDDLHRGNDLRHIRGRVRGDDDGVADASRVGERLEVRGAERRVDDVHLPVPRRRLGPLHHSHNTADLAPEDLISIPGAP